MSNFQNLKKEIANTIKANGNNDIDGTLLQEKLLEMVDSLGKDYKFRGVATPDGEPITDDTNVFYVANTVGTYPYYGGLTVADGEIAFFTYNGSWGKVALVDVARKSEVDAKLSELGSKLIKLKGMAESGELAGVTELGDVYYNTVSKTLQRRKLYDYVSNYEQVPFLDGAIYQYNNDLYVWDGENLVTYGNEIRHTKTELNALSQRLSASEFSLGEYLGVVADFSNKGYIPLDSLKEGSTVELSVVDSSDVYYDILPIKEGYRISLYVEAKYTRSFAIIDANNKVLKLGGGNNSYSTFIAPKDSNRLIVHSKRQKEEYAKVAPILKGLDVQEVVLKEKQSFTIPNIGEICSVTPSGSSAFSSAMYDSSEGDVYVLKGIGGESARLWAFLDSNNAVIAKADANKEKDIVIAPVGTAKVVINSKGTESNFKIGGFLADSFRFDLGAVSSLREIILSFNAEHIICNYGVGKVCDVTPVTSQSGLHYAVVELTDEDKYCRINGLGGNGPRLWCFLDENNIILSVAEANAEANNLLLRVPENAKRLIINDKSGGKSFVYKPSRKELLEIHEKEIAEIKHSFESNEGVIIPPFNERVTPNINSFKDFERKTFCLAGLDTAITNNAMPYTQGLLWHTYPKSDGTLYYSTSVEGEKAAIGKMSQWNPIGRIFAISPKDKRVICTYTEKRAGICIFDGENTTLLESINGVKPCGWLYNSGVDFINDGEDEYCIFAEYGVLNEFHVWRGKYPYTSESDWEIVLTKTNEDITHLHQIRRDPWTDILYCTSGDYVGKLYWWYSLDKGKTWTQLTDGTLWENHCARCINFIFTKDYIYWATDFGENHSLNRIQRGPDGIIDVTTREKLANLPEGQATNSICYHEGANGIFLYERLDSTFQDRVRGYYTLFYSIGEGKLYRLKYYTLNDKDYQDFVGTTNKAWGGHRGKCYLNYTNAQIPYPMMGFTVYTPCIINMIGEDNMAIGTIYYK